MFTKNFSRSQDLQRKLLPVCFPAFARALQDADGDVMSVSAKCLLPTTGLLIEQRNADKVGNSAGNLRCNVLGSRTS